MDTIVDIDGTTLDLTHRLHWIQTKPKNYEAFFAACIHDTPIEPVIEVITALCFSHESEHTAIFCSGRPEKTREDTITSLLNAFKGNIAREQIKLYMRKDNDYRQDYVVKLELLEQIKKDGYNPTMAFEDRTQVKEKAWWPSNIFTFDVKQTTKEY